MAFGTMGYGLRNQEHNNGENARVLRSAIPPAMFTGCIHVTSTARYGYSAAACRVRELLRYTFSILRGQRFTGTVTWETRLTGINLHSQKLRQLQVLAPPLQSSAMEAPLVCLDEEFEDVRSYSEDREDKSRGLYMMSSRHAEDASLSELENFSSEIISFKSMEDLVNEFDEKLNVCFRNYNTKTENLAPVRNQLQIQEEEERLRDEEVWDALTDNYIPLTGEKWREPSLESLNGNESDSEFHEKEEEELNEKGEKDSGIKEDPLITADQVIEEIEEMMQNSPDPEDELEEDDDDDDAGDLSVRSDSVLLQEMEALSQTFNNNWSIEGLQRMTSMELSELLERVERTICDYSEELVQHLARRDELEFEKEVKNSFITALIEVQNKQKEQRELQKKRRKERGLSLQSNRTERTGQMPMKRFSMEGISNILQTGIRQTFGNSGNDKQYLNTVIPYQKKGCPPSVEDLQMLTNILFAMKEDSEKVPMLLTDYILKVLCPT